MPTLDLQPFDVELKNGGQETPSVEGNVQPKESIVDLPRVKDVKSLIGKLSPTEIPSVEGNQGKYLKAAEDSTEWATVPAIPDGTGHAGCFLKQGSSGPVWAEPVTGTDDGSYWTALAVQTSGGIRSHAIPPFNPYGEYVIITFGSEHVIVPCLAEFRVNLVNLVVTTAQGAGYTGSDFTGALAYINANVWTAGSAYQYALIGSILSGLYEGLRLGGAKNVLFSQDSNGDVVYHNPIYLNYVNGTVPSVLIADYSNSQLTVRDLVASYIAAASIQVRFRSE